MLEFKTFGEINLNNTPIVLLAAATAETLDGHMDMANVDEMDLEGEFVGLRDISGGSFQSTLRCPDCQCSIQQYATQRYNRVINRTVIDEMSKRFLVSGKARLHELEGKTLALELDSDKSRKDLLNLIKGDKINLKPVQSLGIMKELEDRGKKFNKLARDVASFVNSSTEKDQPIRKLHDATVKAIRARESISESMDGLAINGVPMVSRDRRIILGSLVAQIKVHFISLTDRLEIGQKFDIMLNNNFGEEIREVIPSSLRQLSSSLAKIVSPTAKQRTSRSSMLKRDSTTAELLAYTSPTFLPPGAPASSKRPITSNVPTNC